MLIGSDSPDRDFLGTNTTICYLILFSLSIVFFHSIWTRHRFVTSKIYLPQGWHVKWNRWFTAQDVIDMKVCFKEEPVAQLQGEWSADSLHVSVPSDLPLLQRSALPEVTGFLGQFESGDDRSRSIKSPPFRFDAGQF